MQRYFLTELPDNVNDIRLEGDDFHHLSRVMRMEAGDQIYLVFPNETAVIAELKEIAGDHALAFTVEKLHDKKELPVDVVIASGLPKGDKLEYVVQKGTELGASCFIPFHADRSIVKWDAKKAEKKTERLTKIAKEAAEQSHRIRVPAVQQPATFEQLIRMSADYTHKIFAYEEKAKMGESSMFHHVLQGMAHGDKLLIVFGPEGGISDKEAAKLEENGFIPCGLGPRILRTETAPLYALASVSYHFELMR